LSKSKRYETQQKENRRLEAHSTAPFLSLRRHETCVPD
jgi:hypothetical protein